MKTFHEVGLEQSLFQRGLGAVGTGTRPPQEPVGEQGVRTLGDVHAESESVLSRGSGEVIEDRIGPLGTSELLRVPLSSRRGLASRSPGVELVGAIDHLDVDRFATRRQ